MTRLASDDLNMNETNALLQKVPGLGFNTSNLVKTVGGQGGKVNPKTLQVEDTNAAVSKILGGRGFVGQALKEESDEDLSDAENSRLRALLFKTLETCLQSVKAGAVTPQMALGRLASELDELKKKFRL